MSQNFKSLSRLVQAVDNFFVLKRLGICNIIYPCKATLSSRTFYLCSNREKPFAHVAKFQKYIPACDGREIMCLVTTEPKSLCLSILWPSLFKEIGKTRFHMPQNLNNLSWLAKNVFYGFALFSKNLSYRLTNWFLK